MPDQGEPTKPECENDEPEALVVDSARLGIKRRTIHEARRSSWFDSRG